MYLPLVMTVIGNDRPGLVDCLATTVAAHQGNWLESRMSHLGGQFAGILRVQVPAEYQENLTRALANLAAEGLTVVVHPDPGELAEGPRASAVLEIVGQDRPGIVRAISHALAAFAVNVEELTTECASAPMSGETLFRAQARLHVPASANAAELRRQLEKIAADLMVDVSLAELPQK